jgi:Redoxin.
MRDLDKRDYTIIASILVLAGAISAGTMQSNNVQSPQTAENWKEIELENVNTGQTFTVSSLDKPVVIETFAVWCPTCTRQQQEMKKLHETSNITSVSLNVDPNEDQQQIVQHTEENSFNWRYAISGSKPY